MVLSGEGTLAYSSLNPHSHTALGIKQALSKLFADTIEAGKVNFSSEALNQNGSKIVRQRVAGG